MAILSKGADDGFTGKIGNTVSYKLYGSTVKRTIGKRTDKPTIPVLTSRQVTKVTSNFLTQVREYVKFGFELEAKAANKSYFSMAASYTRLNAITGIYPEQRIDFTKVVLSKGKMPLTPMITVKTTEDGLTFSWDKNFTAQGINDSDQVMLMAYIPEIPRAYHLLYAAKRVEGAACLSLPRSSSPVIVETYISFISENHKSISNSLYTGQVVWQTQ